MTKLFSNLSFRLSLKLEIHANEGDGDDGVNGGAGPAVSDQGVGVMSSRPDSGNGNQDQVGVAASQVSSLTPSQAAVPATTPVDSVQVGYGRFGVDGPVVAPPNYAVGAGQANQGTLGNTEVMGTPDKPEFGIGHFGFDGPVVSTPNYAGSTANQQYQTSTVPSNSNPDGTLTSSIGRFGYDGPVTDEPNYSSPQVKDASPIGSTLVSGTADNPEIGIGHFSAQGPIVTGFGGTTNNLPSDEVPDDSESTEPSLSTGSLTIESLRSPSTALQQFTAIAGVGSASDIFGSYSGLTNDIGGVLSFTDVSYAMNLKNAAYVVSQDAQQLLGKASLGFGLGQAAIQAYDAYKNNGSYEEATVTAAGSLGAYAGGGLATGVAETGISTVATAAAAGESIEGVALLGTVAAISAPVTFAIIGSIAVGFTARAFYNYFAHRSPIELDLSGSGIGITQLTSSNTFEAINTDGYQHRTAWAAAGDAVLFVDPNGLNTIRDADQYIFTDWDPSATSDMEALRNVFDTNHDGKLDAGDAAFGQFKLMVTNADGTTTVETLAQAGITSIDLTQSSVNRSFADGSSVDGQSSFTRADGTTGTVAAVTYAADAQGYAVKSTTTVNADGSTTVDNRALNADGSLNNDTSSTTSADGNTRTISYDSAGNGVVDHIQTITDVANADGSRTETIANDDGQDQLRDSTATTTAANGDLSIARDLTGGGVTNRTETRKTLAGGAIADIVTDVSANGTEIDRTYTLIGANGLGRDVEVDNVGNNTDLSVYDHSTVYRTVVAADGTRTDTIIGINHDQSDTNSTTIVTSPDAQTRSTSISFDGSTVEQVQLAQTSTDAAGNVTTRVTTYNGDRSAVLGVTATTVSANGLSKTSQVDMNGDGTFDRTTSDSTTTNQNGGQTEDVTVTSADGTLLSEVLTSRSTDGVSRDTVTLDPAGHILASDTIGVGPQGGTREDAYTAGANGTTILGETVKFTSADGLTTTTQVDHAGDGTFDRVVTDQTIKNGNGSATEIVGTRASGGALLSHTVTATSVDGLTVTTQVDSTGALNTDGTAIFDRTTTDTTSYTDDGSRIRTVTVTANNGTVLSSVTTDTGADRQSHSVNTDANGDGFTTTAESVTTAPNGTTIDKIIDLNPDGSHVDGVVRTTSANGLSVTTRVDASGTGTFNRVTTDVTTIDPDTGLRTETVVNAGNNGTVVGQSVTTTQSNGDLTTVSTDTAGDGTFDHVTKTATSHDADGGTTVTVTDLTANGTVRDSTATVTAGNGLSTTVSHDLDGDGVADLTTATSTTYAAGGDVTTTVTDTNADGLRDETTTTVSDNGRTTRANTTYYGSVDYSETDNKAVAATGDHDEDVVVYDAAGKNLRETFTTLGGNGLSKTVQTDLNGAGTYDIVMDDETVLNADGSSTETTTASGSAGMNSQTVVRTAGNGLSKKVQSDTMGNGTFDTVTEDDTTLNPDGSRDEVYQQTNHDLSLRDSTTTHTSPDGKHVTIARVLGSDGHQSETIDRDGGGIVTDVLSDYDGTGAFLGGETVTTSANGLAKTATYKDATGTTQDVQSDTRTLGLDGSTTEAFSDVDANAGISAEFDVRTSGNGLVKKTTAQFSNLPFDNYTTLDTTTLNPDGTLNDTIITTNPDGSTRDQSVRTVSADGLTTSSSLDDTPDGQADITDTKVTATDGSSVRTTTVTNGATGAQDRQDVVTTSADGRTVTLESARDGDTTARYTETTVENPDGTYSDKSQFVSGTLAPSWTQIRSQTLDTTGGQTVVISDYDATGGLDDQTSTTVSGNGLVTQSALDTTGSGSADLIRTDSTTIGDDGTRTETITKGLAPGVGASGPGTTGYGRVITTSADGLTVTTTTDDDGNGHAEKTETSVRGIDGSLVDTVTFNDNTTGESVMAEAADGSKSAGIVKTTSADGLVVTTAVGDIVTQKTFLAGSNGSYIWTQNLNGLSAVPSASHSVDVNGVDTWISSYIPDANAGVGPNTTTTIQIDVAKEQAAVAEANAIYQTVLDRPMMDAEQESLIQYISGGILDQKALAASLIGNSAAFDRNFIQQAYENDFGHDASNSDTAAYLHELQSGNRNQTRAEVAVDIAEKAVNEQAGNGLLALLPDAPKATAMTVTLISPETAAATNTGANYAAFASAIGKPSGNLTPGQISQFAALTGDTGAASAPQVNFASASSSTSGQGTAVPGFFGPPSGSAKPSGGGAAGPLVVNLAGGKVHTTDLAKSTVSFDDTGSGTAATTAWITANEGFLVMDPNGAQVTNGSAMIPTFAALAQYDTNGDGTLTAAEADAAGIKIWVDANGDGVDQAGEVESLGQAGIASINLKAATTGSYDNGNVIAADSSVTFSNGQQGDIADTWLAYGNALAQGAVYQFGNDLVTRAANGTASELLYGTGQTVDAGATGLSTVTDAGSGNILQGGIAATVTLSGAAGDRLIGGSGTDTLLALGDGETVTTGTGTDTVYVAGGNTSVDASLGTSTISLDGANDSVTGATAATTVDLTKGTGARIAATGSTITIEGSIGAEISGSGDTVTAAGRSTITLDAGSSTLTSDAASTVALNGSNDTLSLDRASTVAVAGTSEVIGVIAGTVSLAANASAKVTGNDDFATQASGSSLTVVGTDDTVDVMGTGVTTALDRGSVLLENGTSDVLSGTEDEVIQSQGTSLSLSGTNAALLVTGTGNQSNLSDARVTIQNGASSTVTGSRDVIAAGPTGLSGTLAGSDNLVTVSGSGGQLTIAGLRDAISMNSGTLNVADNSSAKLTGSSDTIGLGASDALTSIGQTNTITAYGQNDTIVATGSGDTIGLQQTGDTVSASSASIDLYGGITASVTGNANTVYLDTSDTLNIGGTGQHITLAGAHDVVDDTGTGDTISVLSTEATMTVSSGTVGLGDGASATITGSGDTIGLGANDAIDVTGSNDAITVYGKNDAVIIAGSGDTVSLAASGATVAIGSGTVGLYDGVTGSVIGSSNSIGLGNNDSLTVSGSGNTVTAYGTNDTISDTGTGNSIILQQNNGSVTASSDNLDLWGNIAAQVQGSGNSIYLDTEDSLTLNGSSNSVRIGNTYSTATITGSGNSVSVGSTNDTVAIGSGTVNLDNNSSASVVGSGNTVGLGSGDAITLKGSGNSVTAYGANDTIADTGTGNSIELQQTNGSVTASSDNIGLWGNIGGQIQGSGNSIYLDTEDSLTLNGSSNSVRIGNTYSTATITGSGNSVSVGSTNDTVAMGAGTVSLDDNSSASVVGGGDTVMLGQGDAVRVVGSGDTVTLNKTGDTVLLQSDGKGTNTVTAGSNSVVEAANGNLSVYGGLASTAVTTSSSTPSIALGNGNTVSSNAVPAKIDGYASNGLHSWEEIFNTMTGALKETDQYQYNASNSLMEIDRYNASNVKTEADLYDPKTSAEIGSYLYASNGHVNEVVDLLHNHDWLSQSNGTYKDKTTGAVSQTQPTLR